MKKDLFSPKLKVLVSLFGFINSHSVAGILCTTEDDEPPVVVVPPSK